MGQVIVSINGRNYRMACDDGQEQHLARLGQELDARISRLREDFGEIGDMRLTIMAALLAADELAEQGNRLRRVEDECKALQDAQAAASERARATEAALATALNAAAERIESFARALDGRREPDRARG